MTTEDILIRKINALPPEKIDQVIDFVDFLTSRDTTLRAERTAAIAAFAVEFAGTELDLDDEFASCSGQKAVME